MNPFTSLTGAVARAFRRQLADAPPGDALYRRLVEIARQPRWYQAGAVPDTLDGRFDMVALVLALALIRLETAGEMQLTADLTERFIEDMDGSLRQMGIGDQVVGKHIGNMVSALGGRLGAYREALADGADPQALPEALARNLHRGAAVAAPALDWQAQATRALQRWIAALPLDSFTAGAFETAGSAA
ncbi:MAG: ubiquinol-cytochrome C chaperone family protein [Polymorphobacter sp.]